METKIFSKYSRIGALIGGLLAGILILASALELFSDVEIQKIISTVLLSFGFPLSYFLYSPINYFWITCSDQAQELIWIIYNLIPPMINGFFLGFILRSEKEYVANYSNVTLMARLYRKLFQGFFFLAYTFLLMGIVSFVVLLLLARSGMPIEEAKHYYQQMEIFVPLFVFLIILLFACFRKLPGVCWGKQFKAPAT